MPFGTIKYKHFPYLKRERQLDMGPVAARPAVKRLAKQVKRLRRDYKPETKHVGSFVAINIPITEVTPANNRLHLFKILKGDGAQDRLGNKVKATGIVWRGQLRNVDALTQDQPNMVRIVMLYDKRPNQAVFNLQDYNDPNPGSGDSLDPAALRNEEYRRRFTVLSDKVYNVGGKTQAVVPRQDTGKNSQLFFRGGRKFKVPKQIVYNNSSVNGDVADTIQGSFYLCVLSQTNSTVGVSLDFETRLYYTDA